MTSTGEVLIMVTDSNDRNPMFESLSYSAQVYENLTIVCCYCYSEVIIMFQK